MGSFRDTKYGYMSGDRIRHIDIYSYGNEATTPRKRLRRANRGFEKSGKIDDLIISATQYHDINKQVKKGEAL